MLKKWLSVLLCILLCGGMFTGCTLFEHNDKKDAQQVIVEIMPIAYTYTDESDKEQTYTSPHVKIYKSELISQMNSNLQNYINQGYTQERAVNAMLDNLILQKLLINEARRREASGRIKWTQKQENEKMEAIYTTIDNQLAAIKNTILDEYDEDQPDTTEPEIKEPTYPTKPAEDEEDADDRKYLQYNADGSVKYLQKKNADGTPAVDDKGEPVYETFYNGDPIPDYEVWEPDAHKYACIGDADTVSLENQAIARFIQLLKDLVADDFRVTPEDKAKFAEDDKLLASLDQDKKYAALGGTHYMQYVVGNDVENSVRVSLLQDMITDDVNVTGEEVEAKYNADLDSQKTRFAADSAAYGTAVTEGSETMLYYQNDDYFYVKHILLPFTDEEKAEFQRIEKNPGYTEAERLAARAALVADMTVYPHVDGEDDKTDPKKVDQVFEEIRAVMAQKSGKETAKEAERAFDDLIYKYNTDTGIFSKAEGYAVKRDDDEGHSGYMEEFYEGAMELYNGDYRTGDLLDHYVVTDYGVHVMYLANRLEGSAAGLIKSLNDWMTPGEYKRVYDVLEEALRTNKENVAFQNWQSENISYYTANDKIVVKHAKRYKDLLGNS